MPPKKDLTITAETKARIHDILQSEFGRQVESIALQPGSNNTRYTGADLNDAVQVQNEVGAYSLARIALASLDVPVTPRIYGWHAVDMDTKAPGWILQEFMRGAVLNDEAFGKLDRTAKDSVVADIARIFHLLQQYKLPASVVGYGGLNFDDDGQVVTGPTAIHGATKACATYHELYNEYLKTQLRRMDECDVVQGWQDTSDMRARIDAFVERGFQPLLERSIEANPRPVLIHGDLNMLNFLYDPETSRITALVDWSFSHVASLSDEYFYSFPELFHIVVPEDPTSPANTIRQAILYGLDAVTNEDKAATPMADWTLIERTNAAFVAAGVTRPADLMPGIDALSDLYWFIQNLSPGLFSCRVCGPEWGHSRSKPPNGTQKTL
ncbi:hypothetical protein Sste5346_006441 [Sporothrix stenoceras]|uniref:Aminoglycoside phosphotransferase domain-containing protein n=1 Tax=Sporothrix stenoceras TaxID=5173 RepID=A0ABR3Z0L4_9PEZI